MAKRTTQYVCQNCGSVFAKWSGKCDSCGEWNTLAEEEIATDTQPHMTGGRGGRKIELFVSTKAFLFFCVIAVCFVFGLRILELIQFIKDGFGMYLFDFFLLMSLIIVIGFVILYLFSLVGTKTPSGDLLKDLKKNMEGTFRYVDDEVKNPDGKNYISLWKMTMSDKMHQFEKLYSAEGKTKRVMKLHKELIYHIMSDPDTLMMGKDPLNSKWKWENNE